jgi:D-alanyl-D-alanine carboxypeptidase
LEQINALAKIERLLNTLSAEDKFSGGVLVGRDGAVLFQQAYGLASKAWGIPNRLETKFNLGSMNKIFTAVAVAKLVEQGRLAYTDTIGGLLPDYPNRVAAEQVTVHHLLTHSSGMGNYWNERFHANKAQIRKVDDYLPTFVDAPLVFEPGGSVAYSNVGYIVLGMIIERTSGMDYFDYIREHICHPAGMYETESYALDQEIPDLAVGYTRQSYDGTPLSSGYRNNLFQHVVKGGPAGGGYSTAGDIYRFANALLGGRLISRQIFDLLTSGKVQFGRRLESRYGYGFMEVSLPDDRVVGHSGSFAGVSTNLDIFQESRYVAVVLSNYDDAARPIVSLSRELLGHFDKE